MKASKNSAHLEIKIDLSVQRLMGLASLFLQLNSDFSDTDASGEVLIWLNQSGRWRGA